MGGIWLIRFGCVVGQVIESEGKRMFEDAASDGRIKKVEQLLWSKKLQEGAAFGEKQEGDGGAVGDGPW